LMVGRRAEKSRILKGEAPRIGGSTAESEGVNVCG
jgi:hypothetical protein